MNFAKHVGQLSRVEKTALEYLAHKAKWKDIPARAYMHAEVTDFWEPCSRAFFILVPPRGEIHRHSDEAIKGITHHLVFQTNPHCLNWWMEDGYARNCHLAAGHRYIVQREPVHWATNEGETDRIHLLVEYG